VLSLSAWGAVRSIAALRWWDVLTEFGSSLSALYLSIGGAVWGVAGGVLFWGISSRKPWSRPALLASAVLWYVQYWVERIFFQAPRANTSFVLIVTTVLLAVIIIAANLLSAKMYFTRIEEHEQAD
jgi:glucose dehydrogenase